MIYAKQKVIDDAKEYFEEMKKETEDKREEREAAWAEQELTAKEKASKAEERKAKREAKKAKEKAAAEGVPEVDPSYGYAADDDPDNLDNYHTPDTQEPSVFAHLVPAPQAPPPAASTASSTSSIPSTSSPPSTSSIPSTSISPATKGPPAPMGPPATMSPPATAPPATSVPPADGGDLVSGELKPPGEEDTEDVEVAHSSGNTRIVVLNPGELQEGERGPELRGLGPRVQADEVEEEDTADMVDENVVDMAMAVALEMEERRMKKEREAAAEEKRLQDGKRLQKEAEELAKEAERSELSIDELTTLRQLEAKLGVGFGQSRGPQLPAVNPHQGQQQHRAALDAYWQFVRENPQDFNGWAYLINACEVVDLIDEIRRVYNAFLPLFPYCYAYWKRYSDIERKAEHWQRALAILHRGLGAIPLSVDLWVAYLELYHKMYSNHEDFGKLFRSHTCIIA